MNRVIKRNPEASLKSYIDMNTKLGKEARSEFEKDFFKLMNIWKNIGKCEKT